MRGCCRRRPDCSAGHRLQPLVVGRTASSPALTDWWALLRAVCVDAGLAVEASGSMSHVWSQLSGKGSPRSRLRRWFTRHSVRASCPARQKGDCATTRPCRTGARASSRGARAAVGRHPPCHTRQAPLATRPGNDHPRRPPDHRPTADHLPPVPFQRVQHPRCRVPTGRTPNRGTEARQLVAGGLGTHAINATRGRPAVRQVNCVELIRFPGRTSCVPHRCAS